MTEHDVVIVGGGAAGLTAALLLIRARRSVLVIDAGQPRNAPAEHMHGYLSREGLNPAALLATGREEITGYGAQVVNDTVERVSADRAVSCASGTTYRARRIVVATGAVDVLPTLPGFAERWGRDVLQCPYCHGFEVAERRLAVFGSNPGGFHHALMLRQWSESVSYLPHTQALSDPQRDQLAARGVEVVEGEVAAVESSDDAVTGVRFSDESVHPCEVVFLPPDLRPRDGFVDELGCERDERGFLRTGAGGRTSVRWLYAAGNSADPRAQVITAAGQGSSVGFELNLDLVQEDLARAMGAR